MPMILLDDLDRKILAHLQGDASIPNIELADRIGLSPAPCLRRVKRMRDEGVIKRTVIEIDYKLLGYGLSSFLEVSLTRHTTSEAKHFLQMVQRNPEITACYMVTGDSDFMLKVLTPDIESYKRLLWDDLYSMPGILKLQSNFVLDTYKDDNGPLLNQALTKK